MESLQEPQITRKMCSLSAPNTQERMERKDDIKLFCGPSIENKCRSHKTDSFVGSKTQFYARIWVSFYCILSNIQFKCFETVVYIPGNPSSPPHDFTPYETMPY